jgi:hypothetical protein
MTTRVNMNVVNMNVKRKGELRRVERRGEREP